MGTISSLRPRSGSLPPLEVLTRQAAPTKSLPYPLLFAALLLLIAFICDYLADPKAMRSMLVLFSTSWVLLSILIQRQIQRVRALEGIIQTALPEVYTQIRSEKTNKL